MRISKIKNLFFTIAMFLLSLNLLTAQTSVYQWSVSVSGEISGETNDQPNAFLWIPENCEQVKAVVFGQHNMCEETIFDHPDFRKAMAELGFAIIWMSPGIDQQWDVNKGSQKVFDTLMADLADVSGYSELKDTPAFVENDMLVFTQTPPRSKYPVKVALVAWQNGINGQFQTAEPKEQTFFITKR